MREEERGNMVKVRIIQPIRGGNTAGIRSCCGSVALLMWVVAMALSRTCNGMKCTL